MVAVGGGGVDVLAVDAQARRTQEAQLLGRLAGIDRNQCTDASMLAWASRACRCGRNVVWFGQPSK